MVFLTMSERIIVHNSLSPIGQKHIPLLGVRFWVLLLVIHVFNQIEGEQLEKEDR